MRFLLRNLLSRPNLLKLQGDLAKPHRWFVTSSRYLQDATPPPPSPVVPSSESATNPDGYLRESYYCNDAWRSRLETPLLKRINLGDFFYDIEKRYQADQVISAIDVDLFANKVTDEDNLDEMEELVHRLRRSPATADTLPSTNYAVLRALLNADRTDDLLRILGDRWNYGIFLDFHLANLLMNEFLKRGNNRGTDGILDSVCKPRSQNITFIVDALKIASLLMLEEDFSSVTSRYFAILSCLKYLQNPTPETSDSTDPVKEESDEEVKIRLFWLRNPYFDDHFDLTDPNHLAGKTLALAGKEVIENESLSNSLMILGWALYGKWDKVYNLLDEFGKKKKVVMNDAMVKVSELCDKALAEIDASPNKKLTKPKVLQLPGVNLDEKDVNEMWEHLSYPEHEKFVPSVKKLIDSKLIPVASDQNLMSKTEQLLSGALAEREDKETKAQLQLFKDWDEQRKIELENQLKRFRKFEVSESVAERKKDLEEKEEVIFFFDNEEEWMMRLPPEEQRGYKLDTQYRPTNQTKFVKTIPPKKDRKKKKKQVEA